MDITRATYDRQYEHVGNVRHGVQTGPWRVEFDAPVYKDDNGSYLKIRQGSIVSLNEDGLYTPGCPAGTTTNKPMPFLCMKNIFDPDVMTGYKGKNMSESTYSGVGDIITGIPLCSGYEVETTEFDGSATYKVNDGLVPGVSGITTDATSIVVNGTLYTYASGQSDTSTGKYTGWSDGAGSPTYIYTTKRTPVVGDKTYTAVSNGAVTTEGSYTVAAVAGAVTQDEAGLVKLAETAPGSTAPYLGFVSVPPGADRYTNVGRDSNGANGRDAYGNLRLAFWANFIPANI